MAVIQITIPDEVTQRVLDAFAGKFGRPENITQPDDTVIPNPETKAQFAKRQVLLFVKNTVKQYEANVASQAAITAANTDVDTDVILS